MAHSVQFFGRERGVYPGRPVHTVRQDADGLSPVRLNHDSLERLEIGFLAEHVQPADLSVQDVINKPSRCYSRCSWHAIHPDQNGGSAPILIASLFPSVFPSRVPVSVPIPERRI